MLNTDLFTPVLAWLDQGGRGLNMDRYQAVDEEDFEGHTCGTVMCIAGAIAEFNQLDLPGPTTLGLQIGMTEEQIANLFFAQGGGECGDMVACRFDEITPAMAAQAIRSMLETGTVSWS